MNIETNPVQFSNVTLGGEQQLGVNAREVHTTLEVKSDFSHWIKRRISQCKFEENYDVIKVVKKTSFQKLDSEWLNTSFH